VTGGNIDAVALIQDQALAEFAESVVQILKTMDALGGRWADIMAPL
jgi:hypothetical protein